MWWFLRMFFVVVFSICWCIFVLMRWFVCRVLCVFFLLFCLILVVLSVCSFGVRCWR